jgi:myo-inositol-1(or 4)-monophosphatase
MNTLLHGLAQHVRGQLLDYADKGLQRHVHGDSPGGDAQFDVDEVAERAVLDYLRANASEPIAVYTEDGSFVEIGDRPRTVLVVDPIDGTRPTSAGLEMGMISIASAPFTRERQPVLADVNAALLLEIKNGSWIYGDDHTGLASAGFGYDLPRLSRNIELDRMFWSIEFNGHPMRLMADAYAHLVDASANSGGIFVFNSATFSISRVITGQLDAYVDIGNRILKDHPHTEAEFRRAGRGSILHLFPYDIAAATYLARLAGLTITDAYGADLGGTELLNLSPANQQSCIATSTPELHNALIDSIKWR